MKKDRHTLLGDFYNYRENVRAHMDCILFGNSMLKESRRNWWNPMYWILGEIKIKRIPPHKILTINKKDWKGVYRSADTEQ